MHFFPADRDLNKPPFIHCYPRDLFDSQAFQHACAQKNLKVYTVNFERVKSLSSIMDLLDEEMNFPVYFGRNWDAVIDVATDLSWDRHPGYALLIRNADRLIKLRSRDVSFFLNVCKAIALRWQEAEDEYAEPLAPTPFHFFLIGTKRLCERIQPDIANSQPMFLTTIDPPRNPES